MSGDAWWVGGAGAVATLAAVFSPFFLQWRKGKTEAALAQQKQAHDLGIDALRTADGMWKELLEAMRLEIGRLNEALAKEDSEHAACRAENAVLKGEIAGHRARIEALERAAKPA
jgi:chromosome segregation ATPase